MLSPFPVAPEPDEVEITFNPLFKSIVLYWYYRHYVQSLNLYGDERVLDFGCGPGVLAGHLARILFPQGELFCLELSHAWMESCRKRLRRHLDVKFLEGDIISMRLDASSFNVIVCHFALHAVPVSHRVALMKEWHRLLKADGRLSIRDHREGAHAVSPAEIRDHAITAGMRETESRVIDHVVLGKVVSCTYAKTAG